MTCIQTTSSDGDVDSLNKYGDQFVEVVEQIGEVSICYIYETKTDFLIIGMNVYNNWAGLSELNSKFEKRKTSHSYFLFNSTFFQYCQTFSMNLNFNLVNHFTSQS